MCQPDLTSKLGCSRAPTRPQRNPSPCGSSGSAAGGCAPATYIAAAAAVAAVKDQLEHTVEHVMGLHADESRDLAAAGAFLAEAAMQLIVRLQILALRGAPPIDACKI